MTYFLAIPFFLLLVLVNWLGFRFKNHHIKKFPGIEHVGIGPTESSLLGLTALLLSFTFGLSATKYESRRQLIVKEANTIESVIDRCDLYDDSDRTFLRANLKEYVEDRIEYYAAGKNEQEILAARGRSAKEADIVWKRVAVLSQDLNRRVASREMVPALNEMIEMITTREAGRIAVVPATILNVLCMLLLVSAFLSGYGSRKLERNKVLVFAFASMTTLALFLIIDLETPRQGIVNLQAAEQLIINLRSKFSEIR